MVRPISQLSFSQLGMILIIRGRNVPHVKTYYTDLSIIMQQNSNQKWNIVIDIDFSECVVYSVNQCRDQTVIDLFI